jgi:hypothetical protein
MNRFLRNISKGVVLIALVVLVILRTVQAQQAVANVQMDTTKVLIGQQVMLKLQLQVPSGTYVAWPSFKDSIPTSLGLIEAFKIDTSFSADKKETFLTQKLRVTSFDTGAHIILPISFYQRTKKGDTMGLLATTREMFYSVMTVPVDTTKAIRDIKGSMGIPLTFKEILPWLLLGLAVLAILFGFVYYLRRKMKHKPFVILPPKPGIPPHVTALEELEKLRKAQLWQSGRVKEYYTSLTDILRTYMEHRFNFNAMEMTTSEIIEHLLTDAAAYSNILSLKEVLEMADLVKFAKLTPLPDRHDFCLNQGISFVSNTSSSALVSNNIPDDSVTSSTPKE